MVFCLLWETLNNSLSFKLFITQCCATVNIRYLTILCNYYICFSPISVQANQFSPCNVLQLLNIINCCWVMFILLDAIQFIKTKVKWIDSKLLVKSQINCTGFLNIVTQVSDWFEANLNSPITRTPCLK